MADWAPPTDASLTSGSVGLSADMLAIRDLAAALARRAPGSPWLNGVGAIDVVKISGAWTVPTGVTRIRISLIGGGGAGGAGTDNQPASFWPGLGGGGGAGVFAIHAELVVTPAQNLTVVIGAAGAGGAGDGGDGGATSVARPADWTVTVNGGEGGTQGFSNVPGAGGAGGVVAVVGDIPGARGEDAYSPAQAGGMSGSGAASALGGGAPGHRLAVSDVGRAGAAYGAGGSGGRGFASGTETKNGGDGAAGVVIIEY